MSMTQAVREFFRAHPGEKFDNATLREKLHTDDGNGISVSLNLMHNNGEVKREKRPSGTGWQYWIGNAIAGARTVKGHACRQR